MKWSGYPDTENSWVNENDVTPDLIQLFNSKGKRTSNPTQVEHRSSVIENSQVDESYFEEGLRNMGFNVQLQPPLDDFQLFAVWVFAYYVRYHHQLTVPYYSRPSRVTPIRQSRMITMARIRNHSILQLQHCANLNYDFDDS